MIRVVRDGMAACNQIKNFASLRLFTMCILRLSMYQPTNQPTRQDPNVGILSQTLSKNRKYTQSVIDTGLEKVLSSLPGK